MDVVPILLGVNQLIRRRRRRLHRGLRLRLRYLRDISNPFDVDEIYFRKLYRLTPALAQQLITLLEPTLAGTRATKIPVFLQVLTALRFFAAGPYQNGLAQNFMHPSSQSSVSRIINRVATALQGLAPNYIRFPQTSEERRNVANRFRRHNPVRGVLGLIDCFVVKMTRPGQNEEAFFNYRYGPAVNVQVICDDRYVIQNIRVCPGSSNDQHIWNHSNIKDYMENLRVNPQVVREEGYYYLLGDNGYSCSPILLTPIHDARDFSPQWEYTEDHTSTRCMVEQTFGILTNMWRCISRRRVLQYTPRKVATIVIASAVLHNFRLLNGIPFQQNVPGPPMIGQMERYDGSYQAGIRHRNELIRRYYP